MTLRKQHPIRGTAGDSLRLAALAGAFLLLVCVARPALCQTETPSAQEPATAEEPSLEALSIQSAAVKDVLHLTVGRSIVLTSPIPLRRVYVGNPAVLQTYTSGSSEVVLTAKAAGISSLVLWDENDGHRLYTISANLDPDAIRLSLQKAFPGSAIHADAEDGRIFLTGEVATEAASDAAFKLASLYAKDVVNSLRVVPVHSMQVQLKLRIVEVDRTRLDQLGINIFGNGRTAVATSTGQFSSTTLGSDTSLEASNPLNIFLYNSKLNVGLTVQDLEQKQILQVLAEPTLTTLSGLPAQFLSGGEFPFPVVEGGGVGNASVVTVQFRPYGVKVEFTPTVNPDGSIRLKLAPEVSTLDFSNAVTISGFTIPALSTRRAETEVEIQNGQSFVVSGLLDHRTTEILSKVPGIGDIPVLGGLFRSKNLNHSVVELVILVTATVVDPLHSSAEAGASEPKLVVPNLDPDAFDMLVPAKLREEGPAASPQGQPAKAGQPEHP